MGKLSENATKLVEAVVEGYLEGGKGLTVKQIAPRLGWSESKVRRVLDEGHGLLEGLTLHKESFTSHSTDYRMMESGSHQAWVYYPTMFKLREMVLALRSEVKVRSESLVPMLEPTP